MMAAVRSGRSRWRSWPLFVAVLLFSALAGSVANPQWAYGYDGPSSTYDSPGTVASVGGAIGGSPVLSATVDDDRYSGSIHDYSYFPVATNTADDLLGTSYGRTGTVVQNPGLRIKGFEGSAQPGHAINQIINRGVKPEVLLDTMRNPRVVLQQAGERLTTLIDSPQICSLSFPAS